jgi:hypothetical protein
MVREAPRSVEHTVVCQRCAGFWKYPTEQATFRLTAGQPEIRESPHQYASLSGTLCAGCVPHDAF